MTLRRRRRRRCCQTRLDSWTNRNRFHLVGISILGRHLAAWLIAPLTTRCHRHSATLPLWYSVTCHNWPTGNWQLNGSSLWHSLVVVCGKVIYTRAGHTMRLPLAKRHVLHPNCRWSDCLCPAPPGCPVRPLSPLSGLTCALHISNSLWALTRQLSTSANKFSTNQTTGSLPRLPASLPPADLQRKFRHAVSVGGWVCSKMKKLKTKTSNNKHHNNNNNKSGAHVIPCTKKRRRKARRTAELNEGCTKSSCVHRKNKEPYWRLQIVTI